MQLLHAAPLTLVVFLFLSSAAVADIAGFPFSDAQAQCNYYNANWPSTTTTYSTGLNENSCTPATLTSEARADYLRVVNMFRYFAGLDPVKATSTSGEANASACALMCLEKGGLQHVGWTSQDKCYSQAGATGCGSSNLAGGLTAPNDNIALWVWDGNEKGADLGHRLWVLNPGLGDIGLGLANNYAAMYVFGDQSYTWSRGWYSWPPEGVTPKAAMLELPMIFHYVDVNFTSYSTAPEIVVCDVLDANCNSVRSGSCYAGTAGYGSYGAIKIPTSISGPGCYTVDLQFRATPGGALVHRKYVSNLWDCTQNDGGATCLSAAAPDCSAKASSDASKATSWAADLF